MKVQAKNLSDQQKGELVLIWCYLRPRVLPDGVQEVETFHNAGRYMVDQRASRPGRFFSLLVEVEHIAWDGNRAEPQLWLHLSLRGYTRKARRTTPRLPKWGELRYAKDLFVGDKLAIQVLPPRAQYVNMDPHVLHLYAPIDQRPVLPDFRMVTSKGVGI